MLRYVSCNLNLSRVHISWIGVGLCQRLCLRTWLCIDHVISLLIWWIIFVDDLYMLNPPWLCVMKNTWSKWMIIFIFVHFSINILSILASMFIWETVLKLSFFLWSLWGLAMRISVISEKWTGQCYAPVSIFWVNLIYFGINCPLKLWYTSSVKPSVPRKL